MSSPTPTKYITIHFKVNGDHKDNFFSDYIKLAGDHTFFDVFEGKAMISPSDNYIMSIGFSKEVWRKRVEKQVGKEILENVDGMLSRRFGKYFIVGVFYVFQEKKTIKTHTRKNNTETREKVVKEIRDFLTEAEKVSMGWERTKMTVKLLDLIWKNRIVLRNYPTFSEIYNMKCRQWGEEVNGLTPTTEEHHMIAKKIKSYIKRGL